MAQEKTVTEGVALRPATKEDAAACVDLLNMNLDVFEPDAPPDTPPATPSEQAILHALEQIGTDRP